MIPLTLVFLRADFSEPALQITAARIAIRDKVAGAPQFDFIRVRQVRRIGELTGKGQRFRARGIRNG